jgi:UDP-N-acetylglucosamine kinase
MSDKLSDRVHKNIFVRRIIPSTLGKVKPPKDLPDKDLPAKGPKLFMMGGQPGAGKSGMKKTIKETLAANGMDAVTIDMDDFRIFHPKYAEFVRENPRTAGDRVQEDVRQWAAELYEEALKRRVNIIYDGTLTRQAEGMIKAADKEGFGVEVHVVATSLEASQQGVRNRYEEVLEDYNKDPNRNPPPRDVPDNVQRGAYNGIPGNLEALCKTGLVSRVRVAGRSGDSLCDLVGKTKVKRDGGTQARRALETERNRVWTQQEIGEYIDRGKNIMKKMNDRGVNKKEIMEVQKTHGAVIQNKLQALDADNKKKDSWIARVVGFDIKDLEDISDREKGAEKEPEEDKLSSRGSQRIVIEEDEKKGAEKKAEEDKPSSGGSQRIVIEEEDDYDPAIDKGKEREGTKIKRREKPLTKEEDKYEAPEEGVTTESDSSDEDNAPVGKGEQVL